VDTDAPADFSVKPTLTGERVVLRPFLLDQDLPELRKILDDPEVIKLTGSATSLAEAPAWDDAAEQKFRDWYGSRNGQADRLDLAVTDKSTGQCVGEVVLNNWNPASNSCSFRILLGPAGRDRGFGSESTRLIVGHGFEQLGLHRIWLDVLNFNPRARHVYEKIGFVVDGVQRHDVRWDGEWIDATLMSILAPEWQHHRGHPAAPLAAG
jgi:RimJ/RimL family protein N-acetyltransferase